MPSNSNHNSNPAALTEATASEKQTGTTADVKPHDSPASVEAESTSNKTEMPLQNEPDRATSETGRANAPLVSKKVGNQNARRHGLYSKHVTWPWESEDDFNILLQEFREEWKPSGRSEEQAVFDLAYLTLLKWRAVASAQLHFSKSTVSDELKSGQCSWDDIIEHQKKVPAHARGALAAATKLIDDLNDAHEKIRRLPYWTDTSDGKEVQRQLMHLQHDVSTLKQQTQKEVIEPVRGLVKTVEQSASRFEEAYQADVIEKELDLLGKLDARIEKVLRRLTSIKVFKRVDGVGNSTPPVLESPPMVPVDSSTEKSSAKVTEAEQNDQGQCQTDSPVAPEHQKGKKPKG